MIQHRVTLLLGSSAARTAAFAVALTALLSCAADIKTGPDYGPVAIEVVQGNGQTATVGTGVTLPPSVLVSNEPGLPVTNVVVTFTVTGGGGSITVNTATTGADGIASLPDWTLGTTAGPNTISAVATGLAQHAVITATGIADAPAKLIPLAQLPATVQNAVRFPTQPRLQIADQYDNAVNTNGLPVTATLVAGNGTLQGTATVTSNASGVAQFTDLAILGPTGNLTLAFNGPSLPTVTSDLHLAAGVPVALALLTPPPSTARIGIQLTQQPVLELRDVSNNPVPAVGVMVTATILSGGGALAGTAAVPSDAAGIERFTNLAFAGSTGTKVLQFSTPGAAPITSGPITVTAGPAALLVKTAGDNQLTAVGTPVPIDPVVTVTDGSGNPVAGVVVTFSVTSGNGSIAQASTATDAQGKASSGAWTLGPLAGPNTLSASASGVAGAPVVFTATGSTVIGPPAQLLPVSGDGQSGVAGSVLAESLVVSLVDGSGHGVPGVPVTWTVLSGGGTLGPAAAVTDGNGRLAASWTLGGPVGNNTARAQAAGFQVGFAATGVAGQASQLTLFAAPSTAKSGIPFVTQPAVALADANGNPVAQANVIVTAAIVSGGGVLGGNLTATTNGQGRATFTDLMVTGLIGARVLSFSAPNVSPVNTGPIQVSAGAAANLNIIAGDGQSALVGTPVPVDPSVQVTDGAGNPVANVAVDFAVTSGGGSIASGSTTSDAQGLASGGAWTLGPAQGGNSLTATSSGLLGSPATFSATGVSSVGQPAAIQIASGNGQTGEAGIALPESLVARVVDANGVGVPNVAVQWAIVNGGGSVSPQSVTSDASGEAAVAWTVGAAAGLNKVSATAAGFSVLFSATGVPGPGFRLVLVTQPSTARSGFAFNPQPVIGLEDSLGNAVTQSGVVVTAAIASGGGALGGTLTATTAGGAASFVDLMVTGLVGARTLQFTAPGLLPVTTSSFPLTAGTATTLAKKAGDNQTAPVGTPVPVDVEVTVTDASGNPVPGVTVNFTVLTGGGNVATPAAVSDAQGVASAGNWTLGPTVGGNTLRAGSTGLTGSPLTFTATGTVGQPASIVKVSGDGQSGLIGSLLAESLVVRVEDGQGNPIPGVQVTWSIQIGGGTVSPLVDVTDNGGLAATAWTLGLLAGPATLQAHLGGLSADFAATILPGSQNGMHAVFSTYLGGNDEDQVRDIAVDAQGNVYVTGGTRSDDFPTTPGAYDRSQNGNYDAYVAKFDPQGNLLWSTLLGGPNYDRAYGIEVDAQGFVYVAGRAGDQFPVTAGAFQTNFKGSPDVLPYGPQDGFVCKIRQNGSGRVWCSYFGTDDLHIVRDIVLDAQGGIYIASSSESGNFPASWFSNAYQDQRAGGVDGVIAKIANDGSQVDWATFIGGSGDEAGEPSLRVDNAGQVFALYSSESDDAPTPNGFDHSLGGVRDLYLVKFSSDGHQLLFGTYLGGSNGEDVETHELALDPQGNPVIGNNSDSPDFPTTAGAFQRNLASGHDGVITRVAADGSHIMNSTFLGGLFEDKTEGISVDAAGNVYVTGTTNTPLLPFMIGGFQPILSGLVNDQWIVKLAPDLGTVLYGSYLGGTDEDLGRAGAVTPGGDFVFGGNIQSTNFHTLNPFQNGFGGGNLDGAVAKFSPGP